MTWETARKYILPALKDGSEVELMLDLKKGHAQLWEGERSAFVTQVRTDRIIHAWLAGGDLKELIVLVPGLESFGRAWGCTVATVTGRKGWDRVLKPFGYERVGAELRKVL
jgi:hypothetical protein